MRQEHTNRLVAAIAMCMALGLCGCDALLAIYGLGPGTDNPNTGGDPPPGTQRLEAITFSPASDFPQGEDPTTIEIGNGSVTFAGGRAGTLRLTGLYADDLYSRYYFAGDTGEITFDGLEVVIVDGYFVHSNQQDVGATMTVSFSGGGSETVESVEVNPVGPSGDFSGYFDTVSAPEGETITGLRLEFNDAAGDNDVASLDLLELTVRDE